MAEKPTLGYWEFRGLGGHCRMLLTHLGVDFEDKRYPFGEAPEFAGMAAWKEEKPTLPMAFPNLPYIIDDDVKVSENKAILRFICQKYKPEYLGRTLAEQAACDEFLDITHGTKIQEVVTKLFPPNFAENLEAVKASIDAWAQKFEKASGNKKFVCGDEPTYVDFYCHELIGLYCLIDETLETRHPKLTAFQNNMKELSGIADYHAAAS
jgi:glutathione S-transferase